MPEQPEQPNFPFIEAQPGFYLRADAGRAFQAMEQAAQVIGVTLPISTAFRGIAWQQKLYDAWVAYLAEVKAGRTPIEKPAMAAKPGTSLHQHGIAVDLHGLDERNRESFRAKRRAWLDQHAARFDWHNTGATFKNAEPWHWIFGQKTEQG